MNIVMVPFHDYKKWLNEGFRTRDAHLCEHFEKSNDVDKILVVNRPTSLAELVIKRQSWKTIGGEVVYKKNGIQLLKMSEKVWCIDFILLDFIKVAVQKKMWWFTAFNYQKVLDGINEAIDELEMGEPVLLLQNPMAIGVAKKVKRSSFVFDAIDNWLYHPQMEDKKLIKENYEYVDNHADMIMTVSEALTKTFPNNKNVHWIPNGVDVEFFADAIKNEQDLNNKKIIGYVGKIQDRVDFELVEECLKRFPQHEFWFLGPVYSQQEKVNVLKGKYKNVIFYGDVHYDKLPMKMKAFDIAIIPHKIDEFTNSMNPLKLYEYIAAGKMVVTTGVAGTGNISEYVLVAENGDTFMHQLDIAMMKVSQTSYNTLNVVNSLPIECKWTSRVDSMIELIGKM